MSKNGNHEIDAIIGALAAKHGVFFKPDDPAFALATINDMVMERIANEFMDRVSVRFKDLETSVRGMEYRAGQLLGRDMREAVEELRNELQRDIESAQLKASELVNRIENTYSRKAVARSVAQSVAWAVAFFAAGFCCGIYRPF